MDPSNKKYRNARPLSQYLSVTNGPFVVLFSLELENN